MNKSDLIYQIIIFVTILTSIIQRKILISNNQKNIISRNKQKCKKKFFERQKYFFKITYDILQLNRINFIEILIHKLYNEIKLITNQHYIFIEETNINNKINRDKNGYEVKIYVNTISRMPQIKYKKKG